jgi:uncharacterized protein
LTDEGGPSGSRIASLDVIRGITVMGIFSVNVIAFAMIDPAYFNPSAYGGFHGADLALWLANYVLIDGKMRTLFSMLFGASMLLVIDRAEANGRSPARVHYARMLTLLGFGLAHFYFVWHGDILSLYALVGMVAFLFRRASATRLATLGMTMMLASSLMFAGVARQMQRSDVAAHRPDATARQIHRWNSSVGFLAVVPGKSAEQTRLAHLPAAARAEHMLDKRLADPFTGAMSFGLPTLGLMLLGMAGYRSGFLTGEWSRRRYRRIALATLASGGLVTLGLGLWVIASHFYVITIFFAFVTLGGPIQVAMAAGYAALIMLLLRPGGAITARLAAVGRAAFSNYLGTSLIAASLFYGPGGWFGQLSRAQAWLVVPLVWLAMLAWSKPWLDRFRYGPFEWAWRSLARGRVESIRKVEGVVQPPRDFAPL